MSELPSFAHFSASLRCHMLSGGEDLGGNQKKNLQARYGKPKVIVVPSRNISRPWSWEWNVAPIHKLTTTETVTKTSSLKVTGQWGDNEGFGLRR